MDPPNYNGHQHIQSRFILVVVALSLIFQWGAVGQKSGHLVPEDHQDQVGLPEDEYLPRVLIATLVRNKAHTLPYFLTLLEDLDYPKDRIAFWMKSDHNEDNTTQILRSWGQEVQDWGEYHSVTIEVVDAPPFRQDDQEQPFQWSSKRFQHIMRLKEEGVKVARKIWADYIWFLDADVFIMNNQTLKHLISKKKDVVAPMLLTGGMYSNFWGGMKDYYYIRTDEYKEILEFKKIGCFPVPLIHSAVLMDVRKKDLPDFKPVNDTIPEDDVIRFALSAEAKGVALEICNDLEYGYLLSPQEENPSLHSDILRLQNLRVEVACYWPGGLPVNEFLRQFVPQQIPPSTIGFDQAYLINLKRRPDRLQKMNHVLEILGIDYTLIEAIDGSTLDERSLGELGIRQLEEYRDPFSKRLMTSGEIGCFLSHYKIWEHMVKYHVNTALVLEDDVRFEPYFVYQIQRVFEETAKLFLDWDLIYLGRKRSYNATEPWVAGSQYIVHVDYSYWTLGYALTLKGAKKLLAAKPLERLVPVDEFLPIMFDKHHNMTWKMAFEKRDLNAFSVEPLLMYPSHYTNEPGYISDTERSSVLFQANCTINRDEL